MTNPNTFIKDPSAVLDYMFDWAPLTNGRGVSDWLAAAETILAFTITITPLVLVTGIINAGTTITDAGKSVTIWLTNGTAGVDYTVACMISTNQLRTDERTINIRVRNL